MKMNHTNCAIEHIWHEDEFTFILSDATRQMSGKPVTKCLATLVSRSFVKGSVMPLQQDRRSKRVRREVSVHEMLESIGESDTGINSRGAVVQDRPA